MEPRRTLRRWLAVTGKGPEWPESPILEPAEIDCERLSKRGLWGIAEGTTMPLRAAAKAGSEPRADVPSRMSTPPILPPTPQPLLEPELSRRNRPMTDLGCLGLFIPPNVCT